MTIRVVIVDDQPVVRTGFRAILDAEDDITVVGEAGDGAHAVRTARREQPDVVLMDVCMPEVDGIAATRQLAGAGGPHVLVVTVFDHDEYLFSALRAGAAGFVLKDLDPGDLAQAVRTVAAGHGLVCPTVTRRLIAEFARTSPPTEPSAAVDGLTGREREVLTLVAGGLANTEIADQLTVSEATVKTHVANLLAKLKLRDRVQLVVFAYEHHLVGPGDGSTTLAAARPPANAKNASPG